MYSPRLYKYLDSYVLYTYTVHAFGSVVLTHTLLVQTHTHDVSAPCSQRCYSLIHIMEQLKNKKKLQFYMFFNYIWV